MSVEVEALERWIKRGDVDEAGAVVARDILKREPYNITAQAYLRLYETGSSATPSSATPRDDAWMMARRTSSPGLPPLATPAPTPVPVPPPSSAPPPPHRPNPPPPPLHRPREHREPPQVHHDPFRQSERNLRPELQRDRDPPRYKHHSRQPSSASARTQSSAKTQTNTPAHTPTKLQPNNTGASSSSVRHSPLYPNNTGGSGSGSVKYSPRNNNTPRFATASPQTPQAPLGQTDYQREKKEREFVARHTDLTNRARSLLTELQALQLLDPHDRNNTVTDNDENTNAIAHLKAILAGRLSSVVSKPPPRSVRALARDILSSESDTVAIDLVVSDFEEVAEYTLSQPNTNPDHPRDRDQEQLVLRKAVLDRKVLLESALPTDSARLVGLGVIHFEHENRISGVGKRYVNDHTFIQKLRVEDIPRNRFMATDDGYAWDMRELAGELERITEDAAVAFAGSPTEEKAVLRNPVTQIGFSPADVERIRGHPLAGRLLPLMARDVDRAVEISGVDKPAERPVENTRGESVWKGITATGTRSATAEGHAEDLLTFPTDDAPVKDVPGVPGEFPFPRAVSIRGKPWEDAKDAQVEVTPDPFTPGTGTGVEDAPQLIPTRVSDLGSKLRESPRDSHLGIIPGGFPADDTDEKQEWEDFTDDDEQRGKEEDQVTQDWGELRLKPLVDKAREKVEKEKQEEKKEVEKVLGGWEGWKPIRYEDQRKEGKEEKEKEKEKERKKASPGSEWLKSLQAEGWLKKAADSGTSARSWEDQADEEQEARDRDNSAEDYFGWKPERDQGPFELQ
ncbi:hypothetical protein QBC46DRAFT_355165 [Diplogelasinospora grovesii]|uniref:Uncharacterized protein n=1 Tax=Diplogelasinospora grovesii TaxID=303347 RepID=A0AAN6S3N4_9PEZI|nr:hypothetical protein QBC46DRAFT_355165 [Diplogelasinospora grovesii]